MPSLVRLCGDLVDNIHIPTQDTMYGLHVNMGKSMLESNYQDHYAMHYAARAMGGVTLRQKKEKN